MVTEKQQQPCTVVEVGNYDDEKPQFGRFVRVQFDAEQGSRRYTLGKDINGSTPEAGAVVFLTLESYLKAEGARDGSGRVFYRLKQRVVEAKAA